MRKLAIVLGILFMSAMVLSSCKSHERCPAYSKAAPQEAPQQG